MRKRKGKYMKVVPRKKGKGKIISVVLASVTLVLLAALAILLWTAHNQSVYKRIVWNGYTGTQEQWLASLVGEEADAEAESAYKLAVKNGYRGSETEWIHILTGLSVEEVEKSPYILACENGFEGTISEWLTQIADKPENLGKSNEKGQKTGYELACEYGYEGTFIEWLVSVTNDRVFG